MYKLAVEVFNAYDESKGDDKVLQTLLERHKAVIKMPSTPATSTQTSASTPVTSALTPALTPAQTSDVSPSGPKTRVNQPQGQETEVQAKVEGARKAPKS
jgi:hypothetical protein